jgi:uncharacterized membrane protein YfhO
MIKSPDFHPDEEAVAEGLPPLTACSGSVRIVSESRHRIELDIDSPQPSFLATSEVHYPGWRAALNESPAPISYTNVAFRGLPVPAGRSRIVFTFHSPRLAQGALLSLGGAVLLLVFLKKYPPLARS